MSSILNTGISGLLATKAALQLTSENISNVDTPGYHRRELETEEILPSGGVRITDVRRAFDGLLATRLREAGSSSGAAEAFQAHAIALENMMLPGPSGITSTLDGLFDAFDALAQNPDEAGLRAALLGAGEALASQINDLDSQLSRQALGVEAERAQGVSDINTLLDGLARIEQELSNSVNIGSRNPLLDQREAALGELARLVPINVEIDDLGRATIRLGSAENGPVLLERGVASHVNAAADGRVTVLSNEFGGAAATLRPASGVLGGLADAADLVAATRSDVDAWAARLASDINAVHSQGVTTTGAAGGPIFLTSGWHAEPAALTRGDTVADILVTDEADMPAGPITLIYDATDALWRAEDGAGTLLAEGADSLSLPGVSISLSGTAWNGDRIMLTSGGGEAGYFRLGVTDPDAIAAGGALIVSADPTNAGGAELSVTPVPGTDGTGGISTIPSLADALAAAAGDTVAFVSSGAVGFIPAGTGSATLSAQPRYAAMDFAFTAGESLSGLSLTRAGTAYNFVAASALNAPDFAAALNNGTLTTTTGESLTELGLVAQASDGVLTLLARDGSLPDTSGLTTSGGLVAGVTVATAADASDIAVFTREGRQVAGAPLTAAEAAALITEANGFDPGAVYSTDGLNAALGAPSVTRVATGGDYALTLPTVAAAGAGLTSFASGTVPPEAPARSLAFQTGAGPVSVELPVGATATWAAEILGDALPLSAHAETRLSLDLPATGTLSFDVTGTNASPASVSVDLGAGGPYALAQAINLQTPSTGIRAEVSSDGQRFELVHDGGADITLSNFTHSGGATVSVDRLDASGTTLATGTLDAAGADAVRIAGAVTLTGAAEFSVLEGAVTTTALRDGFANGAISLERGAAGSQVTLSPAAAAADDLSLRQLSVVG
ncbi:MAG: flagellar hook-associated protein FlgK, partial [Pseudomonadota bacterium]